MPQFGSVTGAYFVGCDPIIMLSKIVIGHNSAEGHATMRTVFSVAATTQFFDSQFAWDPQLGVFDMVSDVLRLAP